MIYLELLWGFLKVGCFAFGGAYGAIPLIRDIVLSAGWLTDEMFTYLVAVSESTPGPIMINMATYIGSVQGGIFGSVVATLAVILPSFIIILLIVALLRNLLKNKYIQAALKGVKPCMIGIIMASGTFLILKTCFGVLGSFKFDPIALVITVSIPVINAVLKKNKKKPLSSITMICVAAIMGIVLYGIF